MQRPLRYRAGEEVLHIESPLRERRILVRGQGIPVKLYYRLDAVLQPGQGLRWPTSLLLEQGIDCRGVLALCRGRRWPVRSDDGLG